jgi:hypothetical protein
MDEIIEPLEKAAEAISHKMTEVARDLHKDLDAESVVDAVLEVGSLVAEVLSSD